MRIKASNDGLTVQAIAGTHNILLGIDLAADKVKGCLGFSIQRTQLTNLLPGKNPIFWIPNRLSFKDSPSPNPNPTTQTTQFFPWQNFRYNDFGAHPGTSYHYLVIAQYGSWNQLQEGRRVELDITTEDPAHPQTSHFFNRAAATSEAYYGLFGTLSPDQITDPVKQKQAYDWLSNGLEQAVLDYLAQATDSTYTLHAAIYEFQKDSLLNGLKQALGRGVDVQVVYHHRTPPLPAKSGKAGVTAAVAVAGGAAAGGADGGGADDTSDKGTAAANDAQIAAIGLNVKRKDGSPVCIPRSASPQGAIMHNKFVVLLQNGTPQAVWTGSTNWTDGGLYGQLNLGIGIYDAALASKYEAFWQGLSKDPSAADSRQNAGKLSEVTSSDPKSIPQGLTAVFSPQDTSSKMLDLYGEVVKAAPFLLVCAPFELADQILEPMKLPHPGRGYFLLLDKEGSLGHDPKAPTDASGEPQPTPKTVGNFTTIKNNPGTLVSVAEPLEGPLYDYQHNLLEHVESFHHVGIHIHAKIIASDPLGPDPILIIGSANYSNGSTHINDENSVILRGPAYSHILDIGLTEFMRMFDTYLFRYDHKNDVKGITEELTEDDSWTADFYQPNSGKAVGRTYFAGTA